MKPEPSCSVMQTDGSPEHRAELRTQRHMNAVNFTRIRSSHLQTETRNTSWRNCHKSCMKCLRETHAPKWMTRILIPTYKYLAQPLTALLLLLALFMVSYSLKPSVAKLPECRRIMVPVSAESNVSLYKQGQNYEEAIECKKGEAISLLLFYGVGYFLGELTEVLRLPGLLGMLIGGLSLRNIGSVITSQNIYHSGYVPNGSYPYNATEYNLTNGTVPFISMDPITTLAALLYVDPGLSSLLRQLALATILCRAGLGLDPAALKKVFSSVFRLAFIPCFCEAITLMIATHLLINWPWVWGAMLGFVCAAVSPAVIVPNMMRLEISGYGVAQGIPTLVVAASSLDDVIAITGFGVALTIGLTTDESVVATIFRGPLEVLAGAGYGLAVAVFICLFPPPKMAHSHALRGLFLVTLAVSGLLGSVVLHLSGAGALSCLVLTFCVAHGWRAGYPWRLLEDTDDDISEVDEPNLGESSVDEEHRRKHERNSLPCKPEELHGRMHELHAWQRHEHRQSAEPHLMESMVEYHPYYYKILRKQYQESTNKEHNSGGTKLKHLNDQDTDSPAFRRHSASQHKYTGHSRRFSLPQPTAHYELHSFHPFGLHRLPHHVDWPRGSICTPPLMKLEEIDESDTDQLESCGDEANEDAKTTNSVSSSHVTPQERGLECLNSMRQTVAAIWWFIQPILFSLIGSEVNLTIMRGSETALGVAALLIGIVVRLGATVLAVLPAKMNMKERLFVGFAWLPKATVQAAVGPVALDTALRLESSKEAVEYGHLILTLAALSILIAAPLGAILMPLTARHLLQKNVEVDDVDDSNNPEPNQSLGNIRSKKSVKTVDMALSH